MSTTNKQATASTATTKAKPAAENKVQAPAVAEPAKKAAPRRKTTEPKNQPQCSFHVGFGPTEISVMSGLKK